MTLPVFAELTTNSDSWLLFRDEELFPAPEKSFIRLVATLNMYGPTNTNYCMRSLYDELGSPCLGLRPHSPAAIFIIRRFRSANPPSSALGLRLMFTYLFSSLVLMKRHKYKILKVASVREKEVQSGRQF